MKVLDRAEIELGTPGFKHCGTQNILENQDSNMSIINCNNWQRRSLFKIQFTQLMHLSKWLKKAFTNNVDPDETPQKAASHQSLHHLPF